MAFSITNNGAVQIAPKPVCALDPTDGITLCLWYRRRSALAAGTVPILSWGSGEETQLRLLSTGIGSIRADWKMPGYTQQSLAFNQILQNQWFFILLRMGPVLFFEMSVILRNSPPWISTASSKSSFPSPLFTDSSIYLGYDDEFGYGEIDIAEISKFDRALSTFEFMELARGADPLQLGT
ncbi:MAG: hypothetical protein PVH19_15495, partial [Planctomycetia bacterium]